MIVEAYLSDRRKRIGNGHNFSKEVVFLILSRSKSREGIFEDYWDRGEDRERVVALREMVMVREEWKEMRNE